MTVDAKTLKGELRSFLQERFEWLAFVRHRIDRELIAAVLSANNDDLAAAWERLQLLHRWWTDSGREKRRFLERAAKVAERTSRIVRSVRGMELPDAVDPVALKESVEKELWALWNRVAPQLREQVRRRQYEEATRTYSTLYPAVHTFFEKVFVMDEDRNLRRNRLALMKQIHESLAGSFADLSKLPLSGVEPL